MIYDVKAINTKSGDVIEFGITGDTEAKCLLAAKRKADEIFPSGLGQIIVQLTRLQQVVTAEGVTFKEG